MKNIAEILKDCPKGTKLYSPILGECALYYIDDDEIIHIRKDKSHTGTFDKFGRWFFDLEDNECLLFPSKENRDWDNFCPFKDGDIITNGSGVIYIVKQMNVDEGYTNTHVTVYVHSGTIKMDFTSYAPSVKNSKIATEEEKKLLLDKLAENGYSWNEETKTIEKLIKPKFKIGDKVQKKCATSCSTVYQIDEIRRGDNHFLCAVHIEGMHGTKYVFKEEELRLLVEEDTNKQELEPTKFDISTLITFESKVLVRDFDDSFWMPAVFGFYYKEDKKYKFFIVGCHRFKQCIPFECNEHLLGKTDDCDEYYKNW